MKQAWHRFDLFMQERRLIRRLFASKADLCGHEWWDFQEGRGIDPWDAAACLCAADEEEDGDAWEILGNSLGLPVFSRSLQQALAEEYIGVNDVQYLPVRVFDSQGNEEFGYAIANITARLAALDYKNSTMLEIHPTEIDLETGNLRVRSIWTAALRAKELEGHDIIRLLEFSSPMFVSDRFVKLFERRNFRGARFQPVPVS